MIHISLANNCFLCFRYIINDPQNVENLPLDLNDGENYQTNAMLEIGFSIEKLVKRINNTLKGLIMTSYITSVALFTIISYMFVTLVTINDTFQGQGQELYSSALFLMCLLYLVRLHFIMKSGQRLGCKMKQSKRVLEDTLLVQGASAQHKHPNIHKVLVLQQRLGIDSPISAYNVLTIGSRTFYATLATVLTYIVILIKLRGSTQSTNKHTHTHNSTSFS